MAKSMTESWTHTAWAEWCDTQDEERRRQTVLELEEGERALGCEGFIWIVLAGMLQVSGMSREEQSDAVDMVRFAFGVDVFEEEVSRDWLEEVNRRGDKEATKLLFRLSQDPGKLGKGWKKAIAAAFADEGEESLQSLLKWMETYGDVFLPELYNLITDAEYGAIQDGDDAGQILKARKKREKDLQKRKDEAERIKTFLADASALHSMVHSVK